MSNKDSTLHVYEKKKKYKNENDKLFCSKLSENSTGLHSYQK